MTPKISQEFLDQLAQEAQDELAFVKAKNAIWEGLGKLYRAWAIHGPSSVYTINALNNLMQLYDEWLD